MDKKGQIGILDVPNEILFQIFRQLTTQDVQRNVALVCKRFLHISRMNGMVTTFELEFTLYSNEKEVRKNVSKIELLLRLHPRVQLKLKIHELPITSFDDNVCQLTIFSPFTKSIKAMKLVHNSEFSDGALLHFIHEKILFEALENLEIVWKEEISFSAPVTMTLFYSEGFWKNFPNLKSLKIYFNFEYCVSKKYLIDQKTLIESPFVNYPLFSFRQ